MVIVGNKAGSVLCCFASPAPSFFFWGGLWVFLGREGLLFGFLEVSLTSHGKFEGFSLGFSSNFTAE